MRASFLALVGIPLLALAASGCVAPAGTGPHADAPTTPSEAARASWLHQTDANAPASPTARPVVDAHTDVSVARDTGPSAAAVLAAPPMTLADEAPDEVRESERHGTIVARHGSRITVRLDDDRAIEVGERAQLLRHFERRLGSATLTGWLDVARVTVVAHDGRSVDLFIDEETARVMINGRKQDQFRAGFLVRLEAAG